MDPFSQAALGAVVGQAVGHRALGYRAAAYGALAGALPDVDVFFSLNGDFVDQLVSHRGITHSLFFAPVIGPALGWLIWYREHQRRDNPGSRGAWIGVITLALLSHPLLDVLTPYGTQLLLPFTNARFAVNAMPIIDPIYTGLLGLGLLLAWLPALRNRASAGVVAMLTLAISSTYLGYGWYQGVRTEAVARAQLADMGITPTQLAAFPTVLQVHLRRVVARTPAEDRVGFYSTWAPCEIEWTQAARLLDRDQLTPFLAGREGSVFDWFAMGWARYDLQPAEEHNKPTQVKNRATSATLRVSDLRYGYDDDPLSSVFTLTAELDSTGAPTQTLAAGRVGPRDPQRLFDRLVQDTYAPACRILSQIDRDAL